MQVVLTVSFNPVSFERGNSLIPKKTQTIFSLGEIYVHQDFYARKTLSLEEYIQVQKGSFALQIFEGMYFWKVKDKKEISSGKLKIAVIETPQEAGMYEYAQLTCFNWQVTLFQAFYSLSTHVMYVAH